MISENSVIDPSKVAIYIRWSTEDQTEGTTLEVQSQTCKAYLVSQGWVVNEDLIFIDDGYSGGSLERPAMTRLRKAVDETKVDCVVVYKLDRLSRSVVDTVNLVCREWEGKCSIKSAREPIDTTTHAGKMFFYTLVNYAEWERSVIKERTYSGKIRRAQEGKNPGFRPPYGYRRGENGQFEIVPEEVAVIQRIYRDYLSGLGCRQILEGLNKDGFKPRIGNMWSQSTVSKILKNPAYIGRLEYGKRKVVGNKRVKKAPSVVVENSLIPPIISREDWEAVQAIVSTRPGFGKGQGSGRSFVSASLLTGLLKCKCGHGFSGSAYSTGKQEKEAYRYYRCHGAHSKGSQYCRCGGIRQDLLDAMVVQNFRHLFGGQEAKDRLVTQLTSKWQSQLNEARAGLKLIEKELTKLEEGRKRYKNLLRDGDITIGEYREFLDDLERDGAATRFKAEQLAQLERQASAGLKGQSRLSETLAKVDEWGTLSHLGQKQLLRQFIQEIHVYRPHRSDTIDCRIVWRWDTASSGAAPALPSRYEVEQPRALPPRNAQRDKVTGRFAPRS